jgi:hypothetical protein
VFVSYKSADAPGHALLLHDRLTRRFGPNVFLDVDALSAGIDWRKEIKARESACGVVLVLIGARWLALLKESTQRAVVEPSDDVARQEVEFALASPDIEVVPVLVDDAKMPSRHELPRSLQALADRQAVQLRLPSYEQDVERLIAHLEKLAESGRRDAPSGPTVAPEPAPGPHAPHHERVASLLRGAGHVVVILGPGVNAGCDPLPSDKGLAVQLAHRFAYEPESPHPRLAEVAQWVETALGRPDLNLSVIENLAVEFQPTAVHRFLAEFPSMVEALGRPKRHLLILTTNYDTALERAFKGRGEPYDLAVYAASSGRFTHAAWTDGDAQPILEPNRYHAFPIGDDLELTRSVIVKIHGAVDSPQLDYGGEDDYVITEDNYIDYLSGSSIEQIVPFQILQKLRSSHCLFLGYSMRDWNLRVFRKRVWRQRIRAVSWAVEEEPDEFERVLWNECGVEVIHQPLHEYIRALSAALRASP